MFILERQPKLLDQVRQAIRARHYSQIEIRTRTWMKPGLDLPPTLEKLVETWVEAHEAELLEQWDNARNNRPVSVVG
jgi:hypothetical protein